MYLTAYFDLDSKFVILRNILFNGNTFTTAQATF